MKVCPVCGCGRLECAMVVRCTTDDEDYWDYVEHDREEITAQIEHSDPTCFCTNPQCGDPSGPDGKTIPRLDPDESIWSVYLRTHGLAYVDVADAPADWLEDYDKWEQELTFVTWQGAYHELKEV